MLGVMLTRVVSLLLTAAVLALAGSLVLSGLRSLERVAASVESGIGPECARIMGVDRGRQTASLPPAKEDADELEVYEASERPELLMVGGLEETRDAEGEVLFWEGERPNGKRFRVYND